MKKALLTLAILAFTLPTAGCGNRMWQDTKDTAGNTYDYVFDTAPTTRSYHETASIPIIEINHRAADTLYSNIGSYELSKKSPVYTKRFTNQNDPSDNAIFGQVMTEQVSDRLVQRGVVITSGEPKAQNYFLPQGVDPKKYSNPVKDSLDKLPPRAARLTGTYVIGDNYIYMAAKITRLDDNAIISGHNWTIPITDNVRELLPQLKQDNGMEPTVKTKFD